MPVLCRAFRMSTHFESTHTPQQPFRISLSFFLLKLFPISFHFRNGAFHFHPFYQQAPVASGCSQRLISHSHIESVGSAHMPACQGISYKGRRGCYSLRDSFLLPVLFLVQPHGVESDWVDHDPTRQQMMMLGARYPHGNPSPSLPLTPLHEIHDPEGQHLTFGCWQLWSAICGLSDILSVFLESLGRVDPWLYSNPWYMQTLLHWPDA